MILFVALLTIPQSTNPGGDVLAIFTAKCAGCHSPQAKEVQGNFNYVLDLSKLRQDANKVIPNNPNSSNLWILVNAGNMPPNGSPTGPLTVGQKEIIRGWIVNDAQVADLPPAGGGSTGTTTVVPPTPVDESLSVSSVPPPPSIATDLPRWIGESHLLFLHFPIVGGIGAVIAESWDTWRRYRSKIPHRPAPASFTAVFCLWIAAIVAIPTVIAGWVYASQGHGAGEPVELLIHRILGTTGGVLVVLAAILEVWLTDGRVRLAMLFVSVAVVTVAAHFGGKLAFGERFLSW